MYLTGKKVKEYPLKHVDFFDYIQKTMIRHCNAIMAEHKRKVEAAGQQERDAVADAQAAAMGKIVKKTVIPKEKDGFGRGSHKKRVLNALPAVGVVNMSRGATEWHPLCVIRTGTKNVAMQSTTDNFTKLFEIVRKCLGEQVALKEAGVQTPVRKLRRRKSNPHHPRGPPDEREYFCQSKGIWITKTRKEEDTTPGGSGKCQKAGANRRFRKSPTGNPVISRIGLRPGRTGNYSEKRRWKPIPNRGQRVLGDKDDKDDDGSSSHDMFAA